jgi:hypothetical protein
MVRLVSVSSLSHFSGVGVLVARQPVSRVGQPSATLDILNVASWCFQTRTWSVILIDNMVPSRAIDRMDKQ